MNDDDLLHEMRGLRPENQTGWAASPRGQAVMARAIAMGEDADPRRRSAPRRMRRLATAGIGVSAVLVSGVAATTMVLRADSPTQAGCYEALDPRADTTEASASLVDRVGPERACAQTLSELGRPVDVGNMISCVNPYGGRGVFPAPSGATAESACAQIGWAVDDG